MLKAITALCALVSGTRFARFLSRTNVYHELIVASFETSSQIDVSARNCDFNLHCEGKREKKRRDKFNDQRRIRARVTLYALLII